jgi:hypothetical protein
MVLGGGMWQKAADQLDWRAAFAVRAGRSSFRIARRTPLQDRLRRGEAGSIRGNLDWSCGSRGEEFVPDRAKNAAPGSIEARGSGFDSGKLGAVLRFAPQRFRAELDRRSGTAFRSKAWLDVAEWDTADSFLWWEGPPVQAAAGARPQRMRRGGRARSRPSRRRGAVDLTADIGDRSSHRCLISNEAGERFGRLRSSNLAKSQPEVRSWKSILSKRSSSSKSAERTAL